MGKINNFMSFLLFVLFDNLLLCWWIHPGSPSSSTRTAVLSYAEPQGLPRPLEQQRFQIAPKRGFVMAAEVWADITRSATPWPPQLLVTDAPLRSEHNLLVLIRFPFREVVRFQAKLSEINSQPDQNNDYHRHYWDDGAMGYQIE